MENKYFIGFRVCKQAIVEKKTTKNIIQYQQQEQIKDGWTSEIYKMGVEKDSAQALVYRM